MRVAVRHENGERLLGLLKVELSKPGLRSKITGRVDGRRDARQAQTYLFPTTDHQNHLFLQAACTFYTGLYIQNLQD